MLKPNNTFFVNNTEVRINSKGMRGQGIGYFKSKDSFRILFLGDSCTFGWGLEYKDSYPVILKTLLEKAYPKYTFEIINAAVPGYSSYQGLMYYKKELHKYNPDMMVVFFGASDRTINFKSDKDQTVPPESILKIDAWLTKNSKFYGFLKLNLLKIQLKHKLSYRVSDKEFKVYLSELKANAEKENKQILFIAPVWRNEDKLIKNYGLDFEPKVDIHSLFQNKIAQDNLRSQDLIYDAVHPSAVGNRIIAEGIFKKIIQENILN